MVHHYHDHTCNRGYSLEGFEEWEQPTTQFGSITDAILGMKTGGMVSNPMSLESNPRSEYGRRTPVFVDLTLSNSDCSDCSNISALSFHIQDAVDMLLEQNEVPKEKGSSTGACVRARVFTLDQLLPTAQFENGEIMEVTMNVPKAMDNDANHTRPPSIPHPRFASFPKPWNDYFQTMVNLTDHQSVVVSIHGVYGQWSCPECVANNFMTCVGNPILSAFPGPVKAVVPDPNVRMPINVATVTNIKSSDIRVKSKLAHDTTSAKPSNAKITHVKRPKKVRVKRVNSSNPRVKKKTNFKSKSIKKPVSRRGPYFLPPWCLFVQEWGTASG